MKVVGIDGSTNRTGIAVFKDGKYITHTIIDLHKITDAYKRIPQMASEIYKYLDDIGKIDVIIMEKSVLKTNVDAVQKLSNLAGAIMIYAFQKGIKFEHPIPTAWRKKVGLQQSSKIKRDILKAEAILAVKKEYELNVSDDGAESILLARSGFDLPKIVITEEDIFEA